MKHETFKFLVPLCIPSILKSIPVVLIIFPYKGILLWLIHTKIKFATDWLQTGFQLASDYSGRIQDFPNGGGRCFVANGGEHILFSGKKCMKLKEIGLKWGGACLLTPCHSKITIFLWIILNSIMKTSYFTYFENNLLKRPPGSLGAMVLLQNCSFDT